MPCEDCKEEFDELKKELADADDERDKIAKAIDDEAGTIRDAAETLLKLL